MSAHKSSYSQPQRLRATIFEIADGVQRRMPRQRKVGVHFNGLHNKLSANRSDFSHLRRGTQHLECQVCLQPSGETSVGIRLTASVKTEKERRDLIAIDPIARLTQDDTDVAVTARA